MENNEVVESAVNETPISTIDETKLNKIITEIIKLEKENVKSKEFNDDAMKKKIQKIIEEEVRCY